MSEYFHFEWSFYSSSSSQIDGISSNPPKRSSNVPPNTSTPSGSLVDSMSTCGMITFGTDVPDFGITSENVVIFLGTITVFVTASRAQFSSCSNSFKRI